MFGNIVTNKWLNRFSLSVRSNWQWQITA